MAIPIGTTQSKPRSSSTFLILIAIIVVLGFGAFAAISFLRPEKISAPTVLLDKFLPQGSGIVQLQKLDLNFDTVLSNPVFRTLREIAPLPLVPPPGGKSNPFL